MGMENGFTIKNKNEPKFEFCFAWFTNFHELHNWIKYNCVKKDEQTYAVTYEDLKLLKEDLLPIAQVLIQIPERKIPQYDDHGYPKKYKLDNDELITEEFNPIISTSSYGGVKTLRLYYAVCMMMDILSEDLVGCYCIEYYASW